MQEAAVSDGESILINTEHVVRCVEDATQAFQFYQKLAMRSGYNKTSWAWSRGRSAGTCWRVLAYAQTVSSSRLLFQQAEDILRGLIQASPTSEQALSLINVLLQRHSLSVSISDPVTAGQTIDEAKMLVEQFQRSVPLKIAPRFPCIAEFIWQTVASQRKPSPSLRMLSNFFLLLHKMETN